MVKSINAEQLCIFFKIVTFNPKILRSNIKNGIYLTFPVLQDIKNDGGISTLAQKLEEIFLTIWRNNFLEILLQNAILFSYFYNQQRYEKNNFEYPQKFSKNTSPGTISYVYQERHFGIMKTVTVHGPWTIML